MFFPKRKNSHFDINEQKYDELKTGSNLGQKKKKEAINLNRFMKIALKQLRRESS